LAKRTEDRTETEYYTSGMIDMLRRPLALRVSYTKLDTYRTCPKKFKFIYIERGVVIPSEKMLIGQAVHSTLETWVAEGGEDLGDLMDMLAASCVAWRAQGEISEEEEQLARDMLIEYYDTFSSLDRGNIVGIEEPFELLVDNVLITGILDRVEWESPGVLMVVDYKTGRTSVSQAQAAKNLQTALYTMAAKQRWPEAEHIITKLVYPRLKKSVIHEFTDEQLATHMAAIRETAMEMRLDHSMPPTGTPPICGNCSFKYKCGWGKKMDKIWQGILRKRQTKA
jgi:CRISPR/Cas system-associated exonuclease Cas4 (RecB family)